MYKLLTVFFIGSFIFIAGCKQKTTLEIKKSRLDSLKGVAEKLDSSITKLQREVDAEDSTTPHQKAKLVTLTPLAPTSFTHYIDLQGNVDANDVSYIAPRNGTGGVVKEIFVKQGDNVHKGQLLLKMEDALPRTNLATAQTKLAYAKDIYQRRKNLWDEKIGQEVDLVTAKNDVDNAESQVKLMQDQLDYTNVVADIDGVVDNITVKLGEMFAPNTQQIRLVNASNLKVVVEVPELYQQRIKVGTPVNIQLPALNDKIITGTVHVAGRIINPGSRTFQAEIRIPASSDIRANQVAVVKLEDYTAKDAITIPVNTLQSDEHGKFVMVGLKQNGKWVAHKEPVTVGQLYSDKIEIKNGLQPGEQLVTDGFQGLYEGQLLSTQ
jgi:membrane fusion protein, multidrug efflux system